MYPISALKLNVIDLPPYQSKSSVNSTSVTKKLLYDCVASFSNSEHLRDNDLQTPWFDVWKKTFLSTFEQCEHEFIGAGFGCIFVLMLDELNNFREIITDLQAKVKADPSLRWFCPNFLKYFVVLNVTNVNSEDARHSNEKFQELSAFYGGGHCFWFNLDANEQVTRLQQSLSQDSADKENMYEHNQNNHSNHEQHDPLLQRVDSALNTPPPVNESGDDHTKHVFPKYELVLSETLQKEIETLLRELITKALIPWSERQLRLLVESISLRKGLKRSLFSATKQLLSMSSSTVNLRGTGSPAVVYSSEANEMQQRKVADLCMCLTLYEPAFNFYSAAKREFQAEGASLYYAGACEGTAVASLLINKFQRHYFDQAIATYIEVCQTSNLGARATLLATDALRQVWPNEAANLFIRMTSEDSDLRSALFLEQAAKCFLESPSPRTRKAAFHFVLAGHRYNKCGLRRHALACYSRFSSSHWTHAIEHVNTTVTRLSQQLSTSDPNSASMSKLSISESGVE